MKLYLGTDRNAARATMNVAMQKIKGADVIRITDSHTVEDLQTALQGGGMFGGKRILVFEGVCAHPELCDVLVDSLEYISQLDDDVFVYEEKPLAELRKKLEKYADTVEKFEAPKKERDTSIFAIANALRARDKKALWVSYMKEVAKENAPEAIHGVLFWAAKDMLTKSPHDMRARTLVAALSMLPHEARRRGEDLEYALERFVISGA